MNKKNPRGMDKPFSRWRVEHLLFSSLGVITSSQYELRYRLCSHKEESEMSKFYIGLEQHTRNSRDPKILPVFPMAYLLNLGSC